MNTSNQMAQQNLWSKLQQLDLVQGEMPASELTDTPWYIRVMQGFAGWIAAFFLLAFFGTVFSWIFDQHSAIALIAIGIIGNTVAYSLFKILDKNEFLHQLGLVVNLCGQLMVAFGIYESIDSFNTYYFFTLFIYQSILVFVIPDYVSRILTTWFALFALFAGFNHLGLLNIGITVATLMFAFVWLYDLSWKKHKSIWEPIGYGLALSTLQFNGQLLFGSDIFWWEPSVQLGWLNQMIHWLDKLLVSTLLLKIVFDLAKKHQIKFQSKDGLFVIFSCVLIVAMGYFIVGMSCALLLLLLGFMKQQRVLLALGIVAFLGFISWYYYQLELTLLTKSIILTGLGIALLIGFYLLSVLSGSKGLSLNNIRSKYRMDKTKWFASATMILVLLFVNFEIYKKEQILDNGKLVLLKLAPADPRSLMQGDYMRLRFEIENSLFKPTEKVTDGSNLSSGYMVIELDENAVGSFVRIDNNKELSDNQVKMRFRTRGRRIRLATHAFFFQEGTAAEYNNAQYGEFRVDKNGELLLNNLRDESFNVLGFNRPSN